MESTFDAPYSDYDVTPAIGRQPNTDPQKSCQPCGCDEGAGHLCMQHREDAFKDMLLPQIGDVVKYVPAVGSRLFTTDAQVRKAHPVFTGVLMYFPDAIAAVAHVSKLGNDQHNPGQPLHWAREKSTDQMDTAARHQMDHGVGNIRDTDGSYHLAKAAWRLLAELQLTIEREHEGQ